MRILSAILSSGNRGWSLVLSLLLSVALTSSCTDDTMGSEGGELAPEEEMFPTLADRDELLNGVPTNDELPPEGKMDAVYPAQFDLIDTQSPVRNQASRGVCSIFATTGLMEHLYIKEGTIEDPDFSEQFLQWSAKVEVGSFPKTEGSSAQSNLEAINRYGIVLEEVWPYETRSWNTSNDPACTGEDRPVICYTNGNPSDSVLAATRFKLPKGRYVNSSPNSIKAVMSEKKIAVIAGMDFFYQSWNHGGSKLVVNRDYFSEGYVLYPNAKDKESSLEKRAGHAILLVGWDDELEVPVMDENGKQILGQDGNPVTEKGFWLFKNSWGTSGFGIRGKYGPGYGWLSYKYVQEYASVYTSDVPKVELVEDCTDGKDNDYNGDADCLDAACADHDACRQKGTVYSSSQTMDIPDNQGTVTSTIEVPTGSQIEDLRVSVDIEHPYIGDLVVAVIAPNDQRVVLHEKTGGSDDNLKKTYAVQELLGVKAEGAWTLEVADKASGDAGRLVAWSLEITAEPSVPLEECGGDGQAVDCENPACSQHPDCLEVETWFHENTDSLAIPDGDPAGELSEIEFTEQGTIQSLKLGIDITHPYRSDLKVSLMSPDGKLVTIVDGEGEDEDNLVATIDLPDFVGSELQGTWILEVVDLNNLDSGTLNSWSLEAVVAP